MKTKLALLVALMLAAFAFSLAAGKAWIPLSVWFSTDHMLLFDAATGQTILASAQLLKSRA